MIVNSIAMEIHADWNNILGLVLATSSSVTVLGHVDTYKQMNNLREWLYKLVSYSGIMTLLLTSGSCNVAN